MNFVYKILPQLTDHYSIVCYKIQLLILFAMYNVIFYALSENQISVGPNSFNFVHTMSMNDDKKGQCLIYLTTQRL